MRCALRRETDTVPHGAGSKRRAASGGQAGDHLLCLSIDSDSTLVVVMLAMMMMMLDVGSSAVAKAVALLRRCLGGYKHCERLGRKGLCRRGDEEDADSSSSSSSN